MASMQSPLIDLVYENDEVARYVGMLERKILYYAVNEIKFRALLEILTDEPWDDYEFKEEDHEIRKLAVDALKRRLGLSDEDARRLVQERWARHNPEPASDSTRTYLVGKTPTPHVVSQSRKVSRGDSPGYDVAKHQTGLARARQNREAGS